MRGRNLRDMNRLNQKQWHLKYVCAALVLMAFIFSGCNNSDLDIPGGTSIEEAIEPSAPQALAALCGDCTASLSWESPDSNGGLEITGYVIYRGTSSSTLSVLTNVGADEYCYCDETAENGVEYFYAVSAINTVGEGQQCEVVSGTPMTVPGTVLELDALGSDGSVNLSWTAPESNGGSDISTYHIYRGTSSGTLAELDTVSGSITEFEDATVVNDITYYYTVSAENAAGEGDECAEVSEMPHPDPTVASAPLDFTAIGSNGKVTLNWSAPSNDGYSTITDYKIYRMTGVLSKVALDQGRDPEYYNHTGGTSTSYEDTGVVNGTTYTYQVLAVNGIGDGQLCGAKSATPITVPGAVSELEAIGANGEVALSWSAPSQTGGSSVTDYNIYRGTTSGNLELLDAVGSSATEYTDETAENDVPYYYTVCAVNEAGEGEESSEVSATPAEGSAPSAPSFVEAWQDGFYMYEPGMEEDSRIYVFWSGPEDDGGSPITAYKVFWGTSSTNCEYIGTTDGETTQLYTNETYPMNGYVQVSAVNAFGEGERSTPQLVWWGP